MFIPVSVGLKQIESLSRTFNRNLVWWDKESLFYWPALLYSAYPFSKIEGLREKEKIPDDVEVFCDSGGYQVYSLGAKLDRDAVFDWQVKTGNVNFCLDKPSKELIGKKLADYKAFEDGMDVTFENAKWYAKKIEDYTRSGKITHQKFVLISQCLSMEQVAVEINRLMEVEDAFKVISVAYHSKEYWGFLSGLMYWYEKLKGKKKDIHLLGVSGSTVIPVLSYIKRFWNGRITFDSSSMYAGGKYRTYMVGAESNKTLSLRSAGKHRKTVLPCLCPYCSILRDQEVDLDDKGIGMLIAMHNLFVIVSRVRFWDWVAKEEDKELRKMIKGLGSYDYLEFIDRCLDYGWERAVKTFWWVSGSRVPVKSREREAEELQISNCFGNFTEEVCKDKCPSWEECKKVSGA